jgi:hypothetical protein
LNHIPNGGVHPQIFTIVLFVFLSSQGIHGCNPVLHKTSLRNLIGLKAYDPSPYDDWGAITEGENLVVYLHKAAQNKF